MEFGAEADEGGKRMSRAKRERQRDKMCLPKGIGILGRAAGSLRGQITVVR